MELKLHNHTIILYWLLQLKWYLCAKIFLIFREQSHIQINSINVPLVYMTDCSLNTVHKYVQKFKYTW